MTAALVLAVVGLTTAAAGFLGVGRLGFGPRTFRRSLWWLVETAGLGAGFLVANLALGFVLVRALALTGRFVSVYALEDPALVALSALQGLALRWALDRS
jgi:hypothetical protein